MRGSYKALIVAGGLSVAYLVYHELYTKESTIPLESKDEGIRTSELERHVVEKRAIKKPYKTALKETREAQFTERIELKGCDGPDPEYFSNLPLNELSNIPIEDILYSVECYESKNLLDPALKEKYVKDNQARLCTYIKRILMTLEPSENYEKILESPQLVGLESKLVEYGEIEFVRDFVESFVRAVHKNVVHIDFLGEGLYAQSEFYKKDLLLNPSYKLEEDIVRDFVEKHGTDSDPLLTSLLRSHGDKSGADLSSHIDRMQKMMKDYGKNSVRKFLEEGNREALLGLGNWYSYMISLFYEEPEKLREFLPTETIKNIYAKVEGTHNIEIINAMASLGFHRASNQGWEVWYIVNNSHQSFDREAGRILADNPLKLIYYQLERKVSFDPQEGHWKVGDFGLRESIIQDNFMCLNHEKSPDEEGAIRILEENLVRISTDRAFEERFRHDVLLQAILNKNERFLKRAEELGLYNP